MKKEIQPIMDTFTWVVFMPSLEKEMEKDALLMY